MRINVAGPYVTPKQNVVHKKINTNNQNQNFTGLRSIKSLANYACSALLCLPLVFNSPTIKAPESDSNSYTTIKFGEKDTHKKDYNYYKNKNYNFTDSIIYANGKIEDFKQGNIPDCALLSTLKGISLTPKGKEIIKEMIHPLDDGSFEIDVCSSSDTDYYTVSRKEFFEEANKNLSSMDDDAKLIEIAFQKYCKEEKIPFKFAAANAMRLITCSFPDCSIVMEEDKAFVETVGEKEIVNSKIEEIYELFDGIMHSSQDKRKNFVLLCGTKDNNVKYGLQPDHTYYVTEMVLKGDIDTQFEGYLKLGNPHFTEGKPQKITIKQFLESMQSIDFLNLNYGNLSLKAKPNLKNLANALKSKAQVIKHI